jgi:hypothetical protein
MRSARLATLVVTLCLAAAAAAQTPNFAGKWIMVPDPAAAGGMGGGLGTEATITQDASTITIKRTTQMGEFTSTYKLDGSESKNTITIQGNTIDQVSTTKWDAGRLTVDTKMSFDGNPVEVGMKMSLDPSGNLLVESTRPDFQGGGAPVTTKATYKKG